MISFGLLFQPVLKVIENAFARDLGGIIQHYMGCRMRYERSRSRPYLYALATLIHKLEHSTPVRRLAARTERESIRQSITLPAVACVLWALSGSELRHTDKTNSCPRGDESDETIKTCSFADLTTTAASNSCSLRARAPRESESPLPDQRPA